MKPIIRGQDKGGANNLKKTHAVGKQRHKGKKGCDRNPLRGPLRRNKQQVATGDDREEGQDKTDSKQAGKTQNQNTNTQFRVHMGKAII